MAWPDAAFHGEIGGSTLTPPPPARSHQPPRHPRQRREPADHHVPTQLGRRRLCVPPVQHHTGDAGGAGGAGVGGGVAHQEGAAEHAAGPLHRQPQQGGVGLGPGTRSPPTFSAPIRSGSVSTSMPSRSKATTQPSSGRWGAALSQVSRGRGCRPKPDPTQPLVSFAGRGHPR